MVAVDLTPEDYAEEAGFAAEILATASAPVRHVLELGSALPLTWRR